MCGFSCSNYSSRKNVHAFDQEIVSLEEESLTKALKFGGRGSGGNSSFQLTGPEIMAAFTTLWIPYMKG